MAEAYQNEVETVKALIPEGANINIQDNHIENVVLNSGANENLEIVRLAIDPHSLLLRNEDFRKLWMYKRVQKSKI